MFYFYFEIDIQSKNNACEDIASYKFVTLGTPHEIKNKFLSSY